MMDQQLILTKSEDEIVIVTDTLDDLKSILLHSLQNKNQKVICKVSHSRYMKILSDYWSLNGIMVDGAKENYENYRFYYLTDLDNNGNAYKIVKVKTEEFKGKCSGCKCKDKRWINPITKICYYNQMINNNYLTKIK